MKKRLFIDLDGTCAEWKDLKVLIHIDEAEKASPEAIEKEIQRQVYDILHQKGYFYNLKPYQNVVDAINLIVQNEADIEVFVLSAAISEQAIADKNKWVSEYMPEIDMAHRIYTPDGEDKSLYIPGGLNKTDTVLDDYNKNLHNSEPPALAIKVLNGVNHGASWTGNKIRYDKPSEEIAKNIVSVCNRELTIEDRDPSMSLDKLLERKHKKSKDIQEQNERI